MVGSYLLCSLASSQAPSIRSFSWSQPCQVLTSAVVVRSKGNMNKQLLGTWAGIFTELGVLSARYRLDKLMEHIKIVSPRAHSRMWWATALEGAHLSLHSIWGVSQCSWTACRFFSVKARSGAFPRSSMTCLTCGALRVDHTRVVDIMRKARSGLLTS